MKIISTVALSIFFFALVTKSLSAGSPQPLIDSNGDEVHVGNFYQLLEVGFRPQLGLVLVEGRNNTCPLDVAQEIVLTSGGHPVTFSPANQELLGGVVYASTDVNIRFARLDSMKTPCKQSLVWKVDNYDESNGGWFITTGGVEGNPGPQTLKNWFKFVGSQGVYKIVHCPTVLNGTSVRLCSDVGLPQGVIGGRLLLSSRSSFYRLVRIKHNANKGITAM